MSGRRALLALAAALVTALPPAGLAVAQAPTQTASPVASPYAGRLDLAAMALKAGDLPAGYRQARYDDEGYTPGHRIAAIRFGGTLSAEAVAATEVAWFYSSTFGTEDGDDWIHVYLSQFPDESAVAAGFALYEDEQRTASLGQDHRDGPGPAAGDDPKETTTGAYPDPGNPARRLRYLDATFRVDRVLAGVVVGTAAGVGETPSPDAALVEQLAATLADRIEATLAGQAPPGIDPNLPERILPLFAAWPWPRNSLEGHKTADEFLGPDGAPAGFSPEYRAGYAAFASVGSAEGGMVHDPPYVDVAIAEFASPEAAQGVLGVAEELLQRHHGRPPSRDEAPAPSLPGADGARAFRTDRPSTGAPDSLHLIGHEIVFVLGRRLVVVNVQVDALDPRADLGQAEAAALDLAAQQADCLRAGGPCGLVRVPAAFAAVPQAAGTPVP